MCDTRAGELILCFSKLDSAGADLVKQIRAEKIEHVSYIESMENRLDKLRLRPNPRLEFDLHLVLFHLGMTNGRLRISISTTSTHCSRRSGPSPRSFRPHWGNRLSSLPSPPITS